MGRLCQSGPVVTSAGKNGVLRLGPTSADDRNVQASTSSQHRARKVAAFQERMRTCTQQPEDFMDNEALWGYTSNKFVLRACMAFNAFHKRASSSLAKILQGERVSVAAMGGGPGAELFAAIVARDILGGGAGRLAVCEWVEGWKPVVDVVARLLGQPIQYLHCDVTKPLNDEANNALRNNGFDFDIVVFSHVLLEAGGETGDANLSQVADQHLNALVLLKDLWVK